MAEHRSLPDYTRFYFTPIKLPVEDLRWSALGDLLLYAVHALAGDVGVQALSFLCVATGCVLLRHLRPGPMNGWMTALLVLVAIGTYQLQLPRNAMFSLPLMAALLLLFSRYRATRRMRFAWWMVGVVGLWSFLHGSYLLGCVLVGCLLIGDVLSGRPDGWGEMWRRARFAVAVLAVTLALVSAGNPAALRMLRRPIDVVTGATSNASTVAQKGREPRPQAQRTKQKRPPAERPVGEGISTRLTRWLNNLIWSKGPGGVQSAEFSSPFDRFAYRPVMVSFALMAFAVGWLLWAQWPPAWPWLASFAATSLLGLSYFRMTGYAAIGAAALILTSPPLRGPIAQQLARRHLRGAALAAVIALGVWGACLTGRLPSWLGNSRHVFAAGKVPAFDDEACQWLLEHHRERRVFTTIVTGSYALHRWRGEKPVFVDGFFAPHAYSVWGDYRRARRRKKEDLLHERYGVELALIEHGRVDWNKLFITMPEWQPAAIGLGCMVYGRHSAIGDAAPRLLFAPERVDALAPDFQRAFAQGYYATLLSLLAGDRIEAARQLAESAGRRHRAWRRFLPSSERETVREVDVALGFKSRTQESSE